MYNAKSYVENNNNDRDFVKLKKLLIIKLGYSETLERSVGRTVNLGDVLRTTFILNYFKDYHTTWLVDKNAIPLLKGNTYIHKILSSQDPEIEKLSAETFDIVINFEKTDDILSFCNSIKAKKFYGFKDNGDDQGNISVETTQLLFMSENVENRKKNKDCWQKVLAEAIGKEWKGEGYILGYKPKNEKIHDIGFNWTTGKRWTNKAWPESYWKELEMMLRGQYSISWQQGFDDLYEYIDWINSCDLILTADTLGLHVGLALNKRVLGLFGPTSPHEFSFYGCGTYLLPDSPYECISCFNTACNKPKNCMDFIYPSRVKEMIEHEFKENISSSKI